MRSRIDLIDYVTGIGNGAISDPCLERAPLGPYVTRIRRSIRVNSGMYHLHSTVHVCRVIVPTSCIVGRCRYARSVCYHGLFMVYLPARVCISK